MMGVLAKWRASRSFRHVAATGRPRNADGGRSSVCPESDLWTRGKRSCDACLVNWNRCVCAWDWEVDTRRKSVGTFDLRKISSANPNMALNCVHQEIVRRSKKPTDFRQVSSSSASTTTTPTAKASIATTSIVNKE